jgi:hypothetical protein
MLRAGLADNPLDILEIEVGGDGHRAFLGQETPFGRALSGTRADDDCNLTADPTHCFSP